MAVNSTSSTPTAPRTSFARRDRVGTGTGGRMATSGLLHVAVVGRGGDRGRIVPGADAPGAIPGSSQHNAPRRAGVPAADSVQRRQVAGQQRPGCGRPGSRPAPQRVVEGGDPGQREAGVGGGQRLGAVVGRARGTGRRRCPARRPSSAGCRRSGPTLPSASIVPVPATTAPPVRSSSPTRSRMPRVSISPADGPPTSSTWMSTSNGADGCSRTVTPSSEPSRSSAALVVIVARAAARPSRV